MSLSMFFMRNYFDDLPPKVRATIRRTGCDFATLSDMHNFIIAAHQNPDYVVMVLTRMYENSIAQSYLKMGIDPNLLTEQEPENGR